MPTTLTILGSTGSIGQQTLDVIARHPDQFQVHALTAKQNDPLLLQQCVQFRPQVVVMVDEAAAERLQAALNTTQAPSAGRPLNEIQVLQGASALEAVAQQAEMVMAAIVGAAGLASTLAAVKAGKKVLLANKEPLVMAGKHFMSAARDSGAVILPVDSEHNAIFQSLPLGYQTGHRPDQVEKLILTASGGPFRDDSLADLEQVTPAQAVKHPNWAMGAKISVDSATMMNKGLEVIEAHWLFNMPLDHIEVIMHPQSIIHSMVAYVDGSLIAQLGDHDMRIPIASCLAWPQRIDSGVAPLDFKKIASLDFQAVDFERFPCLKLAYLAMQAGSEATTILNAANEVAVAAFLAEEIPYLAIPRWVEDCLTHVLAGTAETLEAIIALDQATRRYLSEKFSTAVG